jgi:hypothetical protein
MFHLYMSLFTAALFFVLTPGILLRIPSGGSKVAVAATHALVFALVFHFTHKMVWKFLYATEGFAAPTDAASCAAANMNWNPATKVCSA